MKTLFSVILVFLLISVNGQTTPEKVDSTILESFILDRDYSTQKVEIDTLLISTAQFNPVKNSSYPVFYLGNLGLPSIKAHFADRSYGEDFFYSPYFSSYFTKSSDRSYFKTFHPYTSIHYTTGGNKKTFEQTVDVFHTQNVNRKLNFGFRIHNYSSGGVYVNQRTRLYAISAFSSYEGSNYSIYGQVNYNGAKNNENGGLVNDTLLELMNDSKTTSDGLPVRLSKANSQIKNWNFRIDQVFNNAPTSSDVPAGLFKLGHTIEYSSYKRKYYDDTRTGIDTTFYSKYYGYTRMSNDSVVFQELVNTVSLSLGVVNFWGAPSVCVYVGNQLGQWTNNFPAPITTISDGIYVVDGSSRKSLYNNWLGASFKGLSTAFTWDFDVKSYWTGSRQGDFEASVKLKFGQNDWKYIPGLILEGWQKRTSPSWLLSNLVSSHFIWNSSLDPTNETTLKGSLLLNLIKTNITGQWSRYDHYVMFDNGANPYSSKAFHYFSVKAENTVSFWKFKTQNSGIVQSVTDNVIHIPDFCISHSLWLDYNLHFNLTGGDLNMNIGYLLQYYPSFYADAYMPATGVFYRQVNSKVGNYPYLDLFAIFQVKRTQFFLRYDHVNEGFTGRNYYSSYLYPMPGRMLKFGVRWYLAD